MADWYVSSAAYTAIATFAASHAYIIGDIVKPTAPAARAKHVFRCTVAGTSSTEPSWPTGQTNTVATGGATFTNVTSQSTYAWGAAAGDIGTIYGANRLGLNDRVFISSDHSETTTQTDWGNNFVGGFGVIQYLCVNRAGSVPPVSADLTTGAQISTTFFFFWVSGSTYWQGVSFAATTSTIQFGGAASNMMTVYFKNCSLWLNHSNAGSQIGSNSVGTLILDNTTVQFGNVGQTIGSGNGNTSEIIWINTPFAIVGATIPTALIVDNWSSSMTVRGVDLSAVTNTLVKCLSGGGLKFLFDSCKIAPGVTRFGTVSNSNPRDLVELVNCYDGTNIISESYQSSGAITTEFTITLSGGAADDVGAFSHKMVSNGNADKFANPLNSFWMDVENTITGSSKTATVEIISSAALNTDEIALYLQYEGTSGSSIASFVSSFAGPLTTGSSVASSSATWSGVPSTATNTLDTNFNGTMTYSGGNLSCTGTAGSTGENTRTLYPETSGKFYFEGTINSGSTNIAFGIENNLGLNSNAYSTVNGHYFYSSGVWTNNGSLGTIGSPTTGDTVCVAFDIANKKVWYRLNGGNWDNNVAHNPATNTGGYDITALLASNGSVYPSASLWTVGDKITLNLGATTFAQTAPSGFSGPNTIPLTWFPQKMQVTFTPQHAGRLRGQVRLGKAATIYCNPQIMVT
jgi:hypothetical protein